MDELPDVIEGKLETSIINDPKFRKFILKKTKRGNRNIYRLVEELKRDPEFREAVRVRAEKIEQHDIAFKHNPPDIKFLAGIGVVVACSTIAAVIEHYLNVPDEVIGVLVFSALVYTIWRI